MQWRKLDEVICRVYKNLESIEIFVKDYTQNVYCSVSAFFLKIEKIYTSLQVNVHLTFEVCKDRLKKESDLQCRQ